jgi:hypothetical protein
MMAMVYDFHFPREFSSLILCLGGGAEKLRQPRSQQAHEYHYGKTILLFPNSSFLLPSLSKSLMLYSKHPYCRRPKIHFSISVSAQTEPAVELQSDETMFGRDDFHH